MCLGQYMPLVMSHETAISFDRSILDEYNTDLGGTLTVKDTGNNITVCFSDTMSERDKENALTILEGMGFQ